MRDRLTSAFAVLALFLVVFYIAPLDVLLLNAAEIEASPASVVTLTWQVQALFILVASFLLWRLPANALPRFACVCLVLGFVLYLQGNFFVWDYGPLDGTDIDWRAHDTAGMLELLAWIGLPLAALIWAGRLWPHVRVLALVLVLLQTSSMAILLAGDKAFPAGPVRMERQIDKAFFDLSAERNVLLIVLDTFAAPMFEDIVQQHPRIEQAFDGFTSYDDTLGASPYTLLSIPVILSSTVYENAGTVQAYMGDALGRDSLPAVLRDHGYRADVVTMGTYRDYLEWLPGHDLTTVLYDGSDEIEARAVLQAWDLTLFRFAPHFLKQRVYDHHRWLLQGYYLGTDGEPGQAGGERVMETVPMQAASNIVHERFLEFASLDSESPTFKFIHLFTSHPPFLMQVDGSLLTEARYKTIPVTQRALDQGVFALEQVLDMLAKLEDLGIYDDTLIVVTADHGTDITKSTRPVYKRRAHPLLLVKPFGARGALRYSQARASVLDIPLTIGRAVGVDAGFSGYDLLAGDIPPDRERYYYYFNWEGKEFWNIDHLPFLHKFRVQGPVRELDSWKKVCNLQPAGSGSPSCSE